MNTFTPQSERPGFVLILIILSVGIHVGFFYGVDALDLEREVPVREPAAKYVTFDVEKKKPKPPKKKAEEPKPEPVKPPPEPVEPVVAKLEPDPPPEPVKPPPEPVKAKKEPAKSKKSAKEKPSPNPGSAAPKPNEVPKEAPKQPVKPKFGISMKSTSSSGSGPAMNTGNTATGNPDSANGPGGALGPGNGVGRGTGTGTGDSAGSGSGSGSDDENAGQPVPAHRVSKMPKMSGKCRGVYTPEARKAGVEGSVTLDLVVGADGKTRDIKVTEGLGHGLDASAVRALKKCRFSPGERGGEAVPVKIEGFKISFYLNR